MSNIQIPEELFSRLCGFFLLGKRDPLNEEIICNLLQEKLERIEARAQYMEKKDRG